MAWLYLFNYDFILTQATTTTMEMEVEEKDKIYHVRLDNGDLVDLPAKLVNHFKTLQNMLADIGDELAENDELRLIDADVEIKAPLFSEIIEFYRWKPKPNAEPLSFTETRGLLHYGSKFNKIDVSTLAQLVQLADYLEANEYLVHAFDRLESLIRQMSLAELEALYAKSHKRKAEGSDDGETRKVRIQYRHAWLIKGILASLLPAPLVPGLDGRIRKYPQEVVASAEIVLIQHGKDDIFAHFTLEDDELTEEAILSVARGKQALYREKISEIAVGTAFIAILNTEGRLSVYGQYSDAYSTLSEDPLAGEFCLAMWAGPEQLFALTQKALYQCNDKGVLALTIEPASLIEVSAAPNHALILTTDGVYAIGRNEEYQLGLPERTDKAEQPIKVHALPQGEEARLVAAGNYNSVIVAKSGRIYVTGSNEDIQLGYVGKNEPIHSVIPGWRLMDLGKLTEEVTKAKVKLLATDKFYTSLVTEDNQVYRVGGWSIEKEATMNKMKMLSADITSITPLKQDSFMVTTTTGIYLYGRCYDDVRVFGGSTYDITLTAWKLKFILPVMIEETLAPNKKQKLDCHYCFAKAVFVDKATKSTLLCSRYCLHKKTIAGKRRM